MKTLKITDELHRKIKVFCAENNLKINEWVEQELNDILTPNEPKQKPTTQRPPVSPPRTILISHPIDLLKKVDNH